MQKIDLREIAPLRPLEPADLLNLISQSGLTRANYRRLIEKIAGSDNDVTERTFQRIIQDAGGRPPPSAVYLIALIRLMGGDSAILSLLPEDVRDGILRSISRRYSDEEAPLLVRFAKILDAIAENPDALARIDRLLNIFETEYAFNDWKAEQSKVE